MEICCKLIKIIFYLCKRYNMTVYKKKFPDKFTGRPPKLSDAELIELGKEMIEEIEKHEDWLFLQEFATFKYMSFNYLAECGDREVFSEYYNIAKQILGSRIAKGAGKQNDPDSKTALHPAIASRFLACYHNDVKKHELKVKGIATDYATNRILDCLADALDKQKNSVIKE